MDPSDDTAASGTTRTSLSARLAGHPFLMPTAAFALAAILFFLRRPDILLHAQLWAEDGAVWFAQAHNDGALAALTRPHTGYLQSFSRIVFSLLVPLPLDVVPFVANAIGLAVRCWCVAFLFTGRFGWLDIRARGLIALYIVLMPGLEEVHANITNTHWYLALLSLMVISADRPTRTAWKFHDVTLLVLAGLSGPFGVLLIPAMAIRLVGKPLLDAWQEGRALLADPRIWAICSAATLQVAVMLSGGTGTRSPAPLAASFELLGQILATRVFAGFILPDEWKDGLWMREGACLVIAAAGVCVTALALLRGPDKLKSIIVFTLLMLVIILLSPQQSMTLEQWPSLSIMKSGQRYFVIAPIAWLVVLIWFMPKVFPARTRTMTIISCGTVLAMGVEVFNLTPLPETGYYAAVAEIGEAATGSMQIPIAPVGWTMTLHFGP